MKTTNRFILAFLSCILTICFGIIIFNSHSYAIEGDSKELTFNSVVEIKEYELDGGYIEAGKVNNIVLKLRNANNYTPVNNLVINVMSDSGMIFPTYGNDNQFYVGKLEAGDSYELMVPMIANTNLQGDYIDLKCNMVYESNGIKITNTSTMILPTQNISSIIVSSVEVSAHATVNGKSLLSINYSNNSAGNINDAILTVEGNVSETTKDIALGSVVAGKSYTKDCNIIFNHPGEQNITVKLKYTDLNGQSIEKDLGSYKVTVGEESELGLDNKTDNTILLWGGRLLAFFALVLAAIVTFVYIKKR